MATGLLDELFAAETRAATEYEAAVRGAARGAELDPDTVGDLLARVGKTAAEFARDVQAVSERIALKAAADVLPQIEADRLAAQREASALAAEFEEVRRQYADRIARAAARRDELQAAASQARHAETELRRTAPADRRKRAESAEFALVTAQRGADELRAKAGADPRAVEDAERRLAEARRRYDAAAAALLEP